MDTLFGRLQEAERKCAELTQSLWSRDMDCAAKDQQITSIIADNDRLKAEIGGSAEDADHMKMVISVLRTALVAADVRETKLREWIIYQKRPLCMCFAGCDECDPANAPNIDDLLSTPSDDSELRKMLADVYKECARVCDNMTYPYSGHIRENQKDTWATGTVDCAEAILALEKKARTQ